MVFRFTPSCNCCCTIYRDLFASGIGGWTVVSGTVVHDTDHMELQSAGALVVSNQTNADGAFFHEARFVCPDEGIKWRVIIDYDDSDNYHYLEINFRHAGMANDTTTLQLYKRTAGTNNAIGDPQTTEVLEVSTGFFVRVCLADGQMRGEIDNQVTAVATTTAHGGEKIGYLLEDETDLEVDFVHWQHHKSVRESCPECQIICGNCQGNFSVTLAGFGDGTCDECENLNGTYLLTPYEPGEGSCQWRLVLPFTMCDDGVVLLLDVNRSFGLQILFVVIIGGVQDSGWQYNEFPDPAGDCEEDLSVSVPAAFAGTLCDTTTATVDLVFIEA